MDPEILEDRETRARGKVKFSRQGGRGAPQQEFRNPGAQTDAGSSAFSKSLRGRAILSQSSNRAPSPTLTQFSTVADDDLEDRMKVLPLDDNVHEWLGGIGDVLPYLERDILKTLPASKIETVIRRLQDELPLRRIEENVRQCQHVSEAIIKSAETQAKGQSAFTQLLSTLHDEQGRLKLWLGDWEAANSIETDDVTAPSHGEQAQIQSLSADIEDLLYNLRSIHSMVAVARNEDNMLTTSGLADICLAEDNARIQKEGESSGNDDVFDEVVDRLDTVDEIIGDLFRRVKIHEDYVQLRQHQNALEPTAQRKDFMSAPSKEESEPESAFEPARIDRLQDFTRLDPSGKTYPYIPRSNVKTAVVEGSTLVNPNTSTTGWILNELDRTWCYYDYTADEIVQEDGLRYARDPDISIRLLGNMAARNSSATKSSQSLLTVTPTMSVPRITNETHRQVTMDDAPQVISGTLAASMLKPLKGGRVLLEEGGSEKLFASFSRRKAPRKFFTLGKVFLCLWSESADASDTMWTPGKSWSKNNFGEWVFSKVRRFVVVREDQFHCVALPISTYSQQGVAKRGVRKADHAIIFTGKHPPRVAASEIPDRGEPPLLSRPIRVIPDQPTDSLDPMSRLNFGNPVTIPHNVKVKSFGMVHRDSLQYFKYQFRQVLTADEQISAPIASQPGSDNSLRTKALDSLIESGWRREDAIEILRIAWDELGLRNRKSKYDTPDTTESQTDSEG